MELITVFERPGVLAYLISDHGTLYLCFDVLFGGKRMSLGADNGAERAYWCQQLSGSWRTIARPVH